MKLLETMIAVLGGMVLMSMAVPLLHRMQHRWALWGAAQVVDMSLQWGRMYAVTANGPLSFEVDAGGSGFHWSDPESGETYESSVRFLPRSVRITESPRQPLRFYQRGNAVPAGTYVLSGPGGTCRVIVNAAGRVRIQWN
jgi:Tfp pilus assembly protein FimT